MKQSLLVVPLCLFAVDAIATPGARVFYQVCYNDDARGYVDFDREKIRVDALTEDRLEFESGGTHYTGAKVTGRDFFEGGRDIHHFYAYRVRDDAFFVISIGLNPDAFSLYESDESRLEQADGNIRCRIDALYRFADTVKAFRAAEQQVAAGKQSEFDAQTLGVVTDWARRFDSKRDDSALEQGIRDWWRGAPDAVVINPMLSVKFMQSSHELTRNALDVVLRKTVDALYVYRMKSDGKCYVQWRSFGYEALGGGTFEDDVKDWV